MADANLSVTIDLITRMAEENARALNGSVIGLNSSFQLIRGVVDVAMDAIRGLGDLLRATVGAALEFEKGLVEIGTVAGDINMEKLSKDLMDVSSQFGLTLKDVQKGYYDLVSAGVAVEDANAALQVSSKLAVTGFTDQSVAVNAVTNVMNAWGLKQDELAAAGDSLALTIKKGKLTFEEYSSAIGNVSPAAANAGVSLNQTNAAIAALTLGGKSASESATALKALIVQLAKPTKELEAAFQGATGETLKHAFAQGDLAKVMEGMNKAAGGNFQTLVNLMGSEEAAGAAATLSGKQMGSFTDALGEMEKSAKTAGAVLEKDFLSVSETAGFKLNKAKIEFSNFFTDISGLLLPIVATVAEQLSMYAKEISSFFEQNRGDIKSFVEDAVLAIKAAFAAVNEIFSFLIENKDTVKIIVGSLVAATAAFYAYEVAVLAAATASALFASAQAAGGIAGVMMSAVNPIMLVVAAVAALTAAIIWVNQNVELVDYMLLQMEADINSALIPVVKALAGVINDVARTFIDFGAIVASKFIDMEKNIGDVIQSIGLTIANLISYLKPLADAIGGSLGATLDKVSEGIVKLSSKLKDKAVDDAARGMQVYSSAIQTVDSFTNGLVKSQEKVTKSSQQLADASAMLYNEAMAKNEATKQGTSVTDALAKATAAATKKADEHSKALKGNAGASKEATDKLKELAAEVAKLDFTAKNLGKGFAMIDSDTELKRISEIMGAEKTATAAVEILRLQSIGKAKEADLFRAKTVAEADLKAAQDAAKARADSTQAAIDNAKTLANNYRKNFDSFAASEVDTIKQTEADIRSITKAGEEALKKIEDENLRQSEENLKKKGDNYRLAWDSFAKGEIETAVDTAEEIRQIEEGKHEALNKLNKESLDRMTADWKANIAAIRSLGESLTGMFSGTLAGVGAIAGGDIFGGLESSVKAVTGGLMESLPQIKTIFEGVVKDIPSIAEKLSSSFASAFPGIASGLESSFSFLKDLGSSVGTSMKEGIDWAFGSGTTEKIGGLLKAIPWGDIGRFLADAFTGAANLCVNLLIEGTALVGTALETSFKAISGGFMADFASGLTSLLGTFAANIKSLSEGISSLETFGQRDTTSQVKDIQSSGKEDIDAIKEKYKAEVEAARGASGEISAEKKKQLDEDLKNIKTREEEALKVAKRQQEAAALNIDAEKRAALAVKDLTAEQRQAITDTFAARKLAEKQAYEDRVDAMKREFEAEQEAAKDRAAGLSAEQKTILKNIEEKKNAELKAQQDIIDQKVKATETTGKEANVFTDLAGMIDEFVASFVKNMPKIVASFIDGIPKVITAIAKGLPEIIKVLVKAMPDIIKAIVKGVPQIIRAVLDSIPMIVDTLKKELPALLQMLVREIPPLVKTLIDAIVEMIPVILPPLIEMITQVIVAIIEKIPMIIDAILKMIPLIIEKIPIIIQAIVDMIPGLIQAVVRNLPAIITAIVDAIPTIIDSIIRALPAIIWEIIKAIPQIAIALVEGIIRLFGNMVKVLWDLIADGIGTFVDALWTGIKDWFVQFGVWLKDVGAKIWEGIKDAFYAVFDWLAEVGAAIWEGVKTAFYAVFDWLAEVGAKIWEGVKQAFYSVGDWLAEAGGKIWDGFVSALKAVGNFFYNLGADIWNGLKSGLEDFGDAAGDFISELDPTSSSSTVGKLMPWNWADGGVIPGTGKVPGDSQKNDTIPAMLSPGEMVIPRSAMDGGFSDVMRFVAEQLGAQRMATGGIVGGGLSMGDSYSSGSIVEEVSALRSELRDIGIALAKNTLSTSKILNRWNGDGMPETRTV
jgi:TP901 family phage tail tape measure protein